MRTLGRFLCVVLAAAAVLALAAWDTGKKVVHPPETSMHMGALTITVPRGLSHYGKGSRGVLATDDRRAHRRGEGFAKWSRLSSNGPPANKVALVLAQDDTIGAPPPPSALRLHLPLSLDQPWFREHLRNGRHGYRWGYLSFHGQPYAVTFWSGRAAPARDRAAVLSALTSIRPTR
jgi:hypothetical protein